MTDRPTAYVKNTRTSIFDNPSQQSFGQSLPNLPGRMTDFTRNINQAFEKRKIRRGLAKSSALERITALKT
jgi:hypothetical protein